MMHGCEKSDSVVVAGNPANKAASAVAELGEPRTGTKGNATQQKPLPGTEPGLSVTGAGARTEDRKAKELASLVRSALCRQTPEVGAVCGKSARTGGAQQ